MPAYRLKFEFPNGNVLLRPVRHVPPTSPSTWKLNPDDSATVMADRVTLLSAGDREVRVLKDRHGGVTSA